jgi:hypothetical protein
MKRIFNLCLLASFTWTNCFAVTVSKEQSLSHMILQHDYVVSYSKATPDALKKENDIFKQNVQEHFAKKSNPEILSEVSVLIQALPDGREKEHFQSILSENENEPNIALQELVNSSTFMDMQRGESANWSVFTSPGAMIALGGVIIVAAILVFNRGADKYKQDALQSGSYSKPTDGTFSFNGSATSSYEREIVHSSTTSNSSNPAREECSTYTSAGSQAKNNAESEARRNCYNSPAMTRSFCDSGYMSTSVSNSGDYCSASATLNLHL